MPSEKFPGPNYNRIIETDPQIVKIPLNEVGWGSRPNNLANVKPDAPEMTIKHVGKGSGT